MVIWPTKNILVLAAYLSLFAQLALSQTDVISETNSDPSPYSSAPIEGVPSSLYNFSRVMGTPFQRPTTTTQVVYAIISQWKDPLVAIFYFNNGAVRQDFDRSLEPIFAPIAQELYLAPTPEEFKIKKELFLGKLADNKTIILSSLTQKIAAVTFDPILILVIWMLWIKKYTFFIPVSLISAWVSTRLILEIVFFGFDLRIISQTIGIYTAICVFTLFLTDLARSYFKKS